MKRELLSNLKSRMRGVARGLGGGGGGEGGGGTHSLLVSNW